ncbi:transport and Golgi organization protein 6 homolog [Aricia agestis]|uniref:transport and Golgi organization protein 6 homolog n=1 Tax=Aricia agestis TaxID=91739 RepID=UPI001C202743|nr:transport and Golgi organization protein 6 homolog [Aricia agestis]
MSDIKIFFTNLEKLLRTDDNTGSIFSILKNEQDNLKTFTQLSDFLDKIINEIDQLASEIKRNDNILVSVKDQKLLRTCFQVVISLGVCPCLLPGLGVSLNKRCATADYLPTLNLDDETKYEILKRCTNFIYRSYDIPVLKNIILTFHLSDYLAALIQLAFAPLKKPGTYPNYVMTEKMYNKFIEEKQDYKSKYEFLVKNCFQPMLMKELLVLQNVTDVQPPAFAKRVIAKEMSQRLTAPGGLLSLIRCFLECHNLDTGLEWKKIDMICRIVSTKHGNLNENDYIANICGQLKQILSLNNAQYLTTATSCLLSLYEKYSDNDLVKDLTVATFKPFNYDLLLKRCNQPGTIILSPQDIEHHVQLLHSTINICKSDSYLKLLSSNLYVLYFLSLKCNKEETKVKIKEIIIKGLECLDQKEIKDIIVQVLFGLGMEGSTNIFVETYEAGLAIKLVSDDTEYPTDKAVQMFIELFNVINNDAVVSNLFQATIYLFMNLSDKKKIASDRETLMTLEDVPILVNSIDEQYMNILHILSEISSSKKVLSTLKTNPVVVVDFVENLILKNAFSSNNECVTVALVLLNTILANTDKASNIKDKLHTLLPFLRKMASNQSNLLSILCKETVSLILSEYPKPMESAYQKALENVYDDLLPVRAHGVMELTKLIDANDPETITKRHFVFCLFQEQLKDSDSYLYLSAINGISSLATHCTDDVIGVLCEEFCGMTIEDNMKTMDQENKIAELRMKIGDIIVKVTRRLGEMAIVHKNILLNTMLCGCRDQDPLIRASALSNLAEIALVLHYRIGTIIYEILLCVWNIIESDPAVECRRAAVMIITSLLKGLGKDALIELKENILPIYRTLNKLYKDENEDSVLRLHAQLALEEINDIVKQFIGNELPMEKQFSLLNESEIKFK